MVWSAPGKLAELTEKSHDHVRRDIQKLVTDLSLTFEGKSEPSSGGRPSQVFFLHKRETLILVSVSRPDIGTSATTLNRHATISAPTICRRTPASPPPLPGGSIWKKEPSPSGRRYATGGRATFPPDCPASRGRLSARTVARWSS